MSPSRFADQRGARAAFTISFLAASALYLLLAAACGPALPGVALLFASRLPAPLMHTLPGRAKQGHCGWGRGPEPEGGAEVTPEMLVWTQSKTGCGVGGGLARPTQGPARGRAAQPPFPRSRPDGHH